MKFLFVSYNSGIWVHSFPEALIADSLRNAGHVVKFYHCERVYSEHCTTMSADGIKENANEFIKKSACDNCVKNKSIIKKYFQFDTSDNSDYLKENDYIEVNKILSKITPENFEKFTFKGVDIGKNSLYEPIIHFKKKNINFNDNEFLFYKIYLKNALLSLISFSKIYDIENPDVVVFYSCEYATNQAPFVYAKLKGSSVYTMSAGYNLGHRLQTMMILKGSHWDMKKSIQDRWQELKDFPVPKKNIMRIADHYKVLFNSTSLWAYSAPKTKGFSARDYFKVKDNRRLLVALMSSYDELFAAFGSGYQSKDTTFSNLFFDQIDWIKNLIELARTRIDLHFVFRVHPRDFPNKRERGYSDQSKQLIEIFKNLPENCSPNLPTDNISLYDIAEEADAFLNGHSTSGVEMTFLGHPVVIYDHNLVHYPPDLNYFDPSVTKEGYFSKIDEALKDGWSFDNIRKAHRWINIWHNMLSIDIADGVPFNDSSKAVLTVRQRIIKLITKYKYPSKERQLQSLFRPKLKERQKIVSLFENSYANSTFLPFEKSSIKTETRAIKKNILNIYNFFYKSNSKIKQNTLQDKLAKVLEIK